MHHDRIFLPGATTWLDDIRSSYCVVDFKSIKSTSSVVPAIPICLLTGAQQLASNPAQALVILTKGASFWLIIVLACHLGLWIYHLDVSNAFQSTVDPDPKTFLRCYPEFLLWLEA
jgi:hypothetical protein